jgi:uncharacterized membrane protein HdeD (DUF308 family)
MLWSGSSPLTVVRDGMWGFLLLAGAAWLAIAWSVLRLEPADLVAVAGPVILFGAVTEAVRALAGTRTWWLNAGMAVLFATTGLIMLRDDGSSWTTPAALIGWYLIVRGAADIAISMLSRESDRIWGLLMVVGVLEIGLGFFSTSSFVRTPELVVVVLGGAALVRGVADLVASLRLREASAGPRPGRSPGLTPERAIGVAGYAAGVADFESGSAAQAAGARHRALPHAMALATADRTAPADGRVRAQARPQPQPQTTPAGSAPDLAGGPLGSSPDLTGAPLGSSSDLAGYQGEVRTTADLDAMLALAGVTGAAVPGATVWTAPDKRVAVPNPAEDAAGVPAGGGTPRGVAESQVGARTTTDGNQPAARAGLPLLDPAGRVSEKAGPGMDDTSIIMHSRLVD